MVHELEPHIRLAAVSVSVQSLLRILCPPLSAHPQFALSQKQFFFKVSANWFCPTEGLILLQTHCTALVLSITLLGLSLFVLVAW